MLTGVCFIRLPRYKEFKGEANRLEAVGYTEETAAKKKVEAETVAATAAQTA